MYAIATQVRCTRAKVFSSGRRCRMDIARDLKFLALIIAAPSTNSRMSCLEYFYGFPNAVRQARRVAARRVVAACASCSPTMRALAHEPHATVLVPMERGRRSPANSFAKTSTCMALSPGSWRQKRFEPRCCAWGETGAVPVYASHAGPEDCGSCCCWSDGGSPSR
jgi:hypothetical protein